jgi:hypothetical protein
MTDIMMMMMISLFKVTLQEVFYRVVEELGFFLQMDAAKVLQYLLA